MLKKYLISLLSGIIMFLIGGVLHDFLGLHVIGNIFAYLGIAYALAIIVLMAKEYRPISLVSRTLDSLGGTISDGTHHNDKNTITNRFFLFLILFFTPVLIHVIVFGFASILDPCRNNPGCMAGSASGYFLLLFTVPIITILFFVSLFQCRTLRSEKHKKHLSINIVIAISPFIIFLFLYVFSALFLR